MREMMEMGEVNRVKMNPIKRKNMRKLIRMRFHKNLFLRRKMRNRDSILKYMKKKLSTVSVQMEEHLKEKNVRMKRIYELKNLEIVLI